MASATHLPPAAGLSTSEIAKLLGLTPVEQKQAQAAGPGPRKAPKPRQNFSVRSLLLYRDILKASADALRGEDHLGGAERSSAQLPGIVPALNMTVPRRAGLRVLRRSAGEPQDVAAVEGAFPGRFAHQSKQGDGQNVLRLVR